MEPIGEITQDTYQQRVVSERNELCVKLAALRQFRNTPAYALLDCLPRELLSQQENVMQQYADILGARIAQFK